MADREFNVGARYGDANLNDAEYFTQGHSPRKMRRQRGRGVRGTGSIRPEEKYVPPAFRLLRPDSR